MQGQHPITHNNEPDTDGVAAKIDSPSMPGANPDTKALKDLALYLYGCQNILPENSILGMCPDAPSGKATHGTTPTVFPTVDVSWQTTKGLPHSKIDDFNQFITDPENILRREGACSASVHCSEFRDIAFNSKVCPVPSSIPPEPVIAQLLDNAASALGKAEEATLPFKLQGELKSALLARTSTPQMSELTEAAQSIEDRVSMLQAAVQKAGPLKYAQAIKAVLNYAIELEAIASCSSFELNWRNEYLNCAAKNLKAFMSFIGYGYRGNPEMNSDVSLEGENTSTDVVSQIVQIKNYLSDWMQAMDANQERRIQRVKEAKVQFSKEIEHSESVDVGGESPINDSREIKSLEELLNELASRAVEELPNDAAVFFLGKQGTLLEGTGDNGGSFLLAIDIVRLRQWGLGPKGAGLYRFVGKENDISAAVIVRPKYTAQGKRIELAGSNSNKPRYAKEVVAVLGSPPPIVIETKPGVSQEIKVRPGLSFGNLLKHFKVKPEDGMRGEGQKA